MNALPHLATVVSESQLCQILQECVSLASLSAMGETVDSEHSSVARASLIACCSMFASSFAPTTATADSENPLRLVVYVLVSICNVAPQDRQLQSLDV